MSIFDVHVNRSPINGTIRGAGDAMASMFLVIITQLLIRIPVAIVLSKILGFTGIAIALSVSTIFGFSIVAVYYKIGWWKTRGLVKHIPTDTDAEQVSAPPLD